MGNITSGTKENLDKVTNDFLINYKKDETAIKIGDTFKVSSTGKERQRESTIGWKILVQWTDDSTSWIPLKVLKEHNPIEVAEFAVASEIEN